MDRLIRKKNLISEEDLEAARQRDKLKQRERDNLQLRYSCLSEIIYRIESQIIYTLEDHLCDVLYTDQSKPSQSMSKSKSRLSPLCEAHFGYCVFYRTQ